MKRIIILIILLFIIIFGVIGLTLLSGKSDAKIIDDILTSNNYKLDNNTYKKIITGTSLDDFYNNTSTKNNSGYEEYSFNTTNYDLILFSIVYNSNYYTCTISDNLHSENTNYSCEFTNKNYSYMFSGEVVNNNIECNNNKLNKNQITKYCDYIASKINQFNLEKSKLMSNEEFNKVMSKEKQEIKEE